MSGIFASVAISGSFVARQIYPVCLKTGHLDSVQLTASSTIGGSKAKQVINFFLENPSILGKIH